MPVSRGMLDGPDEIVRTQMRRGLATAAHEKVRCRVWKVMKWWEVGWRGGIIMNGM